MDKRRGSAHRFRGFGMSRRRYELTDEQFKRLQPVLPEVEGRGCPYKDHRQVLNGIFWILRSGRGGTFPSAAAAGRRSMTASAAGRRMEPWKRSFGICRENSTRKGVSTGSSLTWTAPSFKRPVPPRAAQTTIKKGPNRPRGSWCKPGSRV